MTRRDLYGECNVEGHPVDQFTAECCMRCINPECTRSAYGQSHFDQRVNTWYERLFSNVSRMDPDDPRFEQLSAQKFVLIQPSLEVNSSWVDPRDLMRSKPSPEPAEIQEKEKVSSEPTPVAVKKDIDASPEFEIQKKPEIKEEEVEDTRPKVSKKMKEAVASNLAITNTQNKSGQIIPQGNQPSPKTEGTWDAPVPSSDTEGVRVIKPGEKIKLG